MDCQTALQLIVLTPEGAAGWRSAEGIAIREHLASCSQCQTLADDVTEWDARLQAVMVAVPIPSGVHERLLAQLSKSIPQAGPAAGVSSPVRRASRWMWTSLGLLIAMLVGMGYWLSIPPQMQMADVSDSAMEHLRRTPEAQLTPFDGTFSAEIVDAKWRSVCDPTAKGLDFDKRAGHDGAAFRVNIPSLRFRGWLVVVPVSRIADVPGSMVPSAVSYSQAAWNDGAYVFVCIAEQGSIETLVQQWSGNPA